MCKTVKTASYLQTIYWIQEHRRRSMYWKNDLLLDLDINSAAVNIKMLLIKFIQNAEFMYRAALYLYNTAWIMGNFGVDRDGRGASHRTTTAWRNSHKHKKQSILLPYSLSYIINGLFIIKYLKPIFDIYAPGTIKFN